ncbi:uncharacterized protein [Gossypium hirsutum]|uniref:Uncharacterized protein n=2 Tax=Gossypium TaxID=3633 RepID=A0A1U8L3M4_GOSHI|nr:uncharacterized protein LOC107923574 [Gossypium hirsutum]
MEDTRGGDGGGRATKTVRLREDDPLDISDMMGDNSIDSYSFMIADFKKFKGCFLAISTCGYRLASAKAAQHRLDRDVWTSVHFGDMRRALSACERFILLRTNPKEMRDYSILLYHCGLYEQALKFLKLYQDMKSSSAQNPSTDPVSNPEEDAVKKLIVRLNFIAMEEGWTWPWYVRNYLGNNSEPW